MKKMNHVELSSYANQLVEILVEKGYSIDNYEVKSRIKDDKFENFVNIHAINEEFAFWCKYDVYYEEYDEEYEEKCCIHKYSVIKDDNYEEITRYCQNIEELVDDLKYFDNYERLLNNIKEIADEFDNDDENCLENNERFGYLSLKLSNGEEWFFDGDGYDTLVSEYLKSCVCFMVNFEDYIKYSCMNW